MDSTIAPLDPQQRFQALFEAVYLDLLRFVQRRVHPTHAEDVVADVMLVAWRRLDDVPPDLSAARAWLFGVAHKTLQNTRRREGRQDALAVRLAQIVLTSAAASPSPDAIADMLDVAAAWPRLNVVHREAIALAVLDGLSAPEAAVVLGISPTAFRLRLSRARRSLRQHVESSPSEAHNPGEHASVRRPR
jgi:RNA polymerase sigma-70 factor, ECF subfamily